MPDYVHAQPLKVTPEIKATVDQAMAELKLTGEPPRLLEVDMGEIPAAAVRQRMAFGGQGGDVLGFYGHQPGQEPYIGIAKGLSGDELRKVLRHELAHHWQRLQGWGEYVDGDWRCGGHDDEVTAHRFAEGRVRVLGTLA